MSRFLLKSFEVELFRMLKAQRSRAMSDEHVHSFSPFHVFLFGPLATQLDHKAYFLESSFNSAFSTPLDYFHWQHPPSPSLGLLGCRSSSKYSEDNAHFSIYSFGWISRTEWVLKPNLAQISRTQFLNLPQGIPLPPPQQQQQRNCFDFDCL